MELTTKELRIIQAGLITLSALRNPKVNQEFANNLLIKINSEILIRQEVWEVDEDSSFN